MHVSATRDELLLMLERMIQIRLFEEMVLKLSKENYVRGSTHLYIGEEAIAVGALTQLRREDYVLSTHRGHGHCIGKGADMRKMMCELLGRANGYSHGKGGSMHIADFHLNILGANGIVGGGLPLSLGPAVASQLRQEDTVTICFFGDGASHIGSFHESLNLAGVWKLPLIFICENNQYGIGTKFCNASASESVAVRAQAYGMPGISVDGTDVLAVRSAVEEAVARARAGKGPTLIECIAYRWTGHYAGDPATYRPQEEVIEWKKKDPIKILEAYLLNHAHAAPEDLAAMHRRLEAEMEEIVQFAKDSPLPDPAELTTNIFVE